MTMKSQIVFLSIALMLSIGTVVHAQGTVPATIPSQGTVPGTVVTQCTDGVDNDGDGRADRGGVKDAGGKQLYLPDMQCQSVSATCEDGSKDCATRYAATTANNCGSGLCLNIAIKNPLKVDTIQEAIKLFMDAVLKIAIPFIVLAFLWSGFNFVLARGNSEKVTKAKNMFVFTIIGTLLILGAWTITNAIIGTVNSITS